MTETKQDRASKANGLMAIIASRGRHFFQHKGRTSRFEVDSRGRVWFIDSYRETRIYTHYEHEWRGFSEGGTLKALVCHLRDFIRTGEPMPSHQLGPWPLWVCGGDLWGYGDAMEEIRRFAANLGITRTEAARTEDAMT